MRAVPYTSVSSLRSLAFNGITTEGGKRIAEAMRHNNSVKIFW